MIFDAPLLLFLAPAVALAVGFGAWLGRGRRLRLARRWSPALAKLARARGGWAPALLGVVSLLAMVGLAGPRLGRTSITTESRALSLIFAVDISRSMLAEDVGPNRLQRAVRESRRLIEDLGGDRLGLIAFAGQSYILAPLTVDGGAIRMYLDALDPDLASSGGSNLRAVLAQGTQLLSATTEAADRVLVLFTDGEAHDTLPEIVAQAEALKDAGVRLIVVAEGGTHAHPDPDPRFRRHHHRVQAGRRRQRGPDPAPGRRAPRRWWRPRRGRWSRARSRTRRARSAIWCRR